MRYKSSKSLTAPTEKRICVRWAALVFAAVACLLMAVACAPAEKNSKEKDSATFVTTLPNAQAKVVTSNAKLACPEQGGTCPEAIGLFYAKTTGLENTELIQCTAFLVAPTIFATNTHCIPNDLRFAGANCLNRINIELGRTATSGSLNLACDQILSTTEIVENKSQTGFMKKPDYAFIRMKTSAFNRKPLRFTRAGIQNGMKLKVVAIDPVQNEREIRGVLRTKTCVATQNSILTSDFTHDYAPLASAAGCESISGNSGSPVLDSSGRVRGILYGGRSGTDEVQVPATMDIPEQFETATMMSNSACITLPASLVADGGAMNPACLKPASTSSLSDRVQAATPLNAEALFKAWNTNAPRMFEFELHKSEQPGKERFVMPLAKCVRPVSEWNQAPEKSSDGTATLIFEVPIWGVQVDLNSRYQVKSNIEQIGTATLHSIVSLTRLEQGKSVPVIENATGTRGLRSMNRQISLPICEN